jgi:hypothetical protein
VAFHLVPSHFLQLADRAHSLIEPAEWTEFLKYTNFVGTLPASGTTSTPTAGNGPGSTPVPICCLATDILGAIGSQTFGPPQFTQILPDKKGDHHLLKVTSNTAGTPTQWLPVDVRLVGTLVGNAETFSGTKIDGKVSVTFPWPAKPDRDTFNATLEGVPSTPTNAPMPAALAVSIPLRPSWNDAIFVFKKTGNNLQLQVILPGLKGAGDNQSWGAEKISVEVQTPGGPQLAVKGTRNPPLGGKGFTYGDANFQFEVEVQDFVKAPPATYQVTFQATLDSVPTWQKQISFTWDGSTIPNGKDTRFFDLGHEAGASGSNEANPHG